MTSTDPELRDPGEPSEFQGLEIHPGEDPLMVQTGLVQGHQRGAGIRAGSAPRSLRPEWSPSLCCVRPPKGGLSFLKVICTNGDGFDLLLLGTSLFYLKIAKFLNGSENQ